MGKCLEYYFSKEEIPNVQCLYLYLYIDVCIYIYICIYDAEYL